MKISKIKIILEVILIISIFVLIGMINYDYINMKKTEEFTGEIIGEIDKIIKDNENNKNDTLIIADNTEKLNYNQKSNQENNADTFAMQTQTQTVSIAGYNVFGKIKIDKINIEYPILEYSNSVALWKSICKISSNNIDGTGNLCLAGHNMRNLSMFGNLRKLANGDKIQITDLKGKEYVYEVFDKFYINPDEVQVLENTDESIVTLITCNDASNKRLIVRGRLT